MKKGFSHMKIMAICCGLPLIGFLLIGILGIRVPSLEMLLYLACPIGMGYMMLTMHRKDEHAKGKSCSETDEGKLDMPQNIGDLRESKYKSS
jgi:hypothetical protein